MRLVPVFLAVQNPNEGAALLEELLGEQLTRNLGSPNAERLSVSRIKRFAHTLFVDGWRPWLTIGAIASILLFTGIVACDGLDRLRYAALLLQLLGIVVVAIGLSETRALFARPSLLMITKEWFRELRQSLFAQVVNVGTAHEINLAGSIHMSGSATATLTSAPRTVEERLSALENEVAAVRRHANERVERLAADLGHIRHDLVEEASARRRSTEELHRLFEAQAAGSLHLELMGLVWLIMGTLLGSLSELSPLVAWLPCRA